MNISKNIDNFILGLENIYKSTTKIDIKVILLQYIFTYLSRNVTSYVSSNIFEQELNKISEEIKQELPTKFKKNSVLHIATEIHSTGGHTKLLENIILNTEDIFDEQSLVLTHHSSEKPARISAIIERTGKLITLKKDKLISKAQYLAQLASNYEYIMLHIHPDDIITNLAFGNKDFKRPVFFVNHADHKFWTGVSISDLVFELSSEGKEFSAKYRGVENNEVINIPIRDKKEDISKEQAREHLKFDLDKKIILSIGSEFKYGTTKDEVEKFINMAMQIVNSIDNSEFILIGPSKKNIFWNEAYIKSSGKINPIGQKPMEELKYYIKSSNLYIESFPFGSYTAFLDVAVYNIELISLKTQTFMQDSVRSNNLFCESIEEIVTKSKDILTNKKKEVSHNIDIHLPNKWKSNFLDKIYQYKDKTHEIIEFYPRVIENNYYNHLKSIIKDDLALRKIYQKLPIKIKIKIIKLLILNNKIKSIKDAYKLFYKTIF